LKDLCKFQKKLIRRAWYNGNNTWYTADPAGINRTLLRSFPGRSRYENLYQAIKWTGTDLIGLAWFWSRIKNQGRIIPESDPNFLLSLSPDNIPEMRTVKVLWYNIPNRYYNAMITGSVSLRSE